MKARRTNTVFKLTIIMLGSHLLLGASEPEIYQEARVKAQVHRIMDIQSRMSQGDSLALSEHAAAQQMATVTFTEMTDRELAQDKNIRTLALFVLTGGSPSVLRRLVGNGILSEKGRQLIDATIALISDAEAKGNGRAVLPQIAEPVEPLLAAALSVSKATFLENSDPERAIALLDEVRLLAPGTLMEETALRRQISLHLKVSRPHRALALLTVYSRRFPASPYSAVLARRLGGEFAAALATSDNEELQKSVKLLQHSSPKFLATLLLEVARESLRLGKLELCRLVASSASLLVDLTEVQRARAAIYLNAAVIVSAETREPVDRLKSIPREGLEEADLRVLLTALSLADLRKSDGSRTGPQSLEKNVPANAASPQDALKRYQASMEAAATALKKADHQ